MQIQKKTQEKRPDEKRRLIDTIKIDKNRTKQDEYLYIIDKTTTKPAEKNEQKLLYIEQKRRSGSPGGVPPISIWKERVEGRPLARRSPSLRERKVILNKIAVLFLEFVFIS